MRKTLDIEGNVCKDFMLSWCCHPCTQIQMAAELKDASRHDGQYSSPPQMAYVFDGDALGER